MPRPSPQTDRVVAVIDLLASRDDGATMTEISRHLAISQASCVHLLAALTTAGYLVREPDDRRYHLGPALAGPGRMAEARYPLLAAARDRMAALSSQFGRLCFAFAPEGDHARLVHCTWPAGQPTPQLRLGETVPLTPPLGIVFVAWGPDAAFEDWLGAAPGSDAGRDARYREQRDSIRSLGFVAEVAPPPTQQDDLARVMDDRESPHRDGQLYRLLSGRGDEDVLLTDLPTGRAGAEPRPVTGIGAPVFDAAGAVVLSLNLVTFPDPLGIAEIARIGAAVRAAADHISLRLSTL